MWPADLAFCFPSAMLLYIPRIYPLHLPASFQQSAAVSSGIYRLADQTEFFRWRSSLHLQDMLLTALPLRLHNPCECCLTSTCKSGILCLLVPEDFPLARWHFQIPAQMWELSTCPLSW